MAKQLQLLHKSGLTSRSAANDWVTDTLKKRTGAIGEPIVAVYTENNEKHALLALCLSGTDYQIIDIDDTKSNLQSQINAVIKNAKESSDYHYDPSETATTLSSQDNYFIKGVKLDSKKHVVGIEEAALPEGVDIDSKLDVGTNADAAGVESYYGLKADIKAESDARANAVSSLTDTVNAKANSSDVYGKAETYTKGEVNNKINAAVSSVYKVKGSCAYAQLPSTGNVEGDVWNVTDSHDNIPAGTNYVWIATNGSVAAHWDPLGGTVDLSTYATTDYVSKNYAAKSHSHAISDVTNLQSALDSKSNTGHAHTSANITDSISAASGITTGATALVQGKAVRDAINTAVSSKADKSSLDSYLPLTGGTLEGGLTINGDGTPLIIYGTSDEPQIKISGGEGILINGDASSLDSASLAVGSTSAPFSEIHSKKFVTTNGKSAQFVKGDGSLDSNSYALSSHNHDAVYAPKSIVDNALTTLSSVTSASTDFVQGKVVKEVDTKVINLGNQVVQLLTTIGELQNTIDSLKNRIESLEGSAITTLNAGDEDITIDGEGNTRTITLKSVTGGEL